MYGVVQQVFAGLASGGIYASLALALVMIYRSTHHLNFAQGEMATFSTFLAWALLRAGWTYWWAFVASILMSLVMGIAVQHLLLRRLEKQSALTNVIGFIALMLIFNGLSGWLFGHSVRAFPSPFVGGGAAGSRLISTHNVGAIATVLACLVVLYAFFRYTALGLALRGAAVNGDSARLLGINVSWMLALGWGLAAAIGAIGGMLVAPSVFLDPNMMSGIVLYGFAGALLGGIDNPWGAVAGGFVVGVVENLLGAYVIGTELKMTVALVFIVGILTVRPNGLFGHRVVVRV